MRRTYTRERYLALVDRLRDAIPDLALGTDMIVGFPGETEEDFGETLEVVEQVALRQRVHVRVLAPRRAPRRPPWPDQVPEEVKRERMERLVESSSGAPRRATRTRIGRVEEVLVEGPEPHRPERSCRGRTRRNTTVNFGGAAEPGDLVDVEIEARPRRRCAGENARSWPREGWCRNARVWTDRCTLGAIP